MLCEGDVALIADGEAIRRLTIRVIDERRVIARRRAARRRRRADGERCADARIDDVDRGRLRRNLIGASVFFDGPQRLRDGVGHDGDGADQAIGQAWRQGLAVLQHRTGRPVDHRGAVVVEQAQQRDRPPAVVGDRIAIVHRRAGDDGDRRLCAGLARRLWVEAGGGENHRLPQDDIVQRADLLGEDGAARLACNQPETRRQQQKRRRQRSQRTPDAHQWKRWRRMGFHGKRVVTSPASRR